jgi:uncharacterized metal-binding protein
MPSGKAHDLITVVTAAAAVPVVLSSSLPEIGPATAAVLIGTYLASGLIFSPDLDLQSKPYKRWGPLRFIWIPYQRLVPHRSWISHSFIFGPLFRVVYFGFMAILLYLIATLLLNLFTPIDTTGTLFSFSRTIANWVDTHPTIIYYAFAGLVLGGAAHTLADIVYSWVKRRMRRLL